MSVLYLLHHNALKPSLPLLSYFAGPPIPFLLSSVTYQYYYHNTLSAWWKKSSSSRHESNAITAAAFTPPSPTIKEVSASTLERMAEILPDRGSAWVRRRRRST